MTNSDQILQRMTTPRPRRKGASEAEIAADIAQMKTTAKLIASVKGQTRLGGVKA